MPQPYSSPPSRKRSTSSPSPPVPGAKEGPSSGIFTAGLPDSPLDESASEEDFSFSAADTPFPPDGSLSATEPFPEGLFRLPLPDWLFSKMAEMSDSALRSLLGLTRLSFRFDPKASSPDTSCWVKPARSFTRKEIESETGLSSQGARNGLAELAEAGHVSIDSSGRSFEYTLEISVPTARYTYVPTAFLEVASALSGTEVRLVLTVLRATWGWTEAPSSTKDSSTKDPDANENAPAHRRWARLSTQELARRTGRSETAIKKAATQLQDCFLERLRPTGGAYYYRFLPEAVRPDTSSIEDNSGESASEEKSAGETSEPRGVRVKKKAEARIRLSLFGGIANNLTHDRQQSAPPRRGTIESSSKRSAKQCASSKQTATGEKQSPSSRGNSAVLGSETPPRSSTERPAQSDQVNLTGFSDRKQELGQKLANAGIWPSAIPGLLGRFSTGRIEANFELFRKRAPEVQNQGAWLRTAIEEGYALPSSVSSVEETSSEGTPSARGSDGNRKCGNSSFKSTPEPGTKVSETRRRELIRRGLASEADFDRFAHYDDPKELQHFFQLEKAGSPADG